MSDAMQRPRARPTIPTSWALLHALPKTDLHCHLDGSLRLGTILELAGEQGVDLPAGDEAGLAASMQAGGSFGSLERYLAAFDTTIPVLQTRDALHRAAYELAIDNWEDGVRYFEARFSPVLHQRRGLEWEAILDAVLAGLHDARREVGVRSGVIVCALRHLEPEVSRRLAGLAVAFTDRGVCGFDLAGPERGFSAALHQAAFRLARSGNLATTCHAGEADGPSSIAEALEACGANRIGHGVRLGEDRALLDYLNRQRIPLECCPSSNVQTGAVPSFEQHPLKSYLDLGLRMTINTDNRLVSNTTATRELLVSHQRCGLSLDDLISCVLNGWTSAFLPDGEKRELLQEATAAIGRLLAEAEARAAAGPECSLRESGGDAPLADPEGHE